jgi:hypothetical protein
MDDIDMDHVSDLMAFVDIPSVSRQIYHLIRRIVIIGPIRRRIVLLGHLERLSYIKSKKAGEIHLPTTSRQSPKGGSISVLKKGLKFFSSKVI